MPSPEAFVFWFKFALVILGVLLFAVAVVYCFRRDCPHCGEAIRRRATRCPHCGGDQA